jgi:hypothetical protein
MYYEREREFPVWQELHRTAKRIYEKKIVSCFPRGPPTTKKLRLCFPKSSPTTKKIVSLLPERSPYHHHHRNLYSVVILFILCPSWTKACCHGPHILHVNPTTKIGSLNFVFMFTFIILYVDARVTLNCSQFVKEITLFVFHMTTYFSRSGYSVQNCCAHQHGIHFYWIQITLSAVRLFIVYPHEFHCSVLFHVFWNVPCCLTTASHRGTDIATSDRILISRTLEQAFWHVLVNLSFLMIFCQVSNRTSNRTRVQAVRIRCNKRRTESSTKARLLVVIIKLLHRFRYLFYF